MAVTAGRLENLTVASPCSASWEEMRGDDRSRHCAQCRLRVYNLSAMTRREALELVQEKEGRLCVRFYRRADGTVLTSDCPAGALRRRARRYLVGLAALASLAFGSLMAMTANRTGEREGTSRNLLVESFDYLFGAPPTCVVGDPVPPPELNQLGRGSGKEVPASEVPTGSAKPATQTGGGSLKP